MKKMKLAKVLKVLIDSEKITLRKLSSKTGVPQATLSSYLAGGSSNKMEHILALAEHFNVSMEFLLFGEEKKRPSLEDVFTEELFSGWLKVKIERAIPTKHKHKIIDED